MPVLVDANTRLICQGITGAFGARHTLGCLNYGTKLVGGVTPGKGGEKDPNGLPIFNTAHHAKQQTDANASMIFVPPPFAADAILEAIDADIKLIAAITEHVPVQDMVRVRAHLDEVNLNRAPQDRITLIGPNCPGIITPGPKTGDGTSKDNPYTNAGCKIGIMPGYIHQHISEAKLQKNVAIVSRSGTLTYEAVWQTSALGLGQSTCIGIGGDPVRGLGFTECLQHFADDNESHAILMIGEIGGTDEEDAAQWVQREREAGRFHKPIAGFIAGRTAPPGKRMGHAGAIIAGGKGGAEDKVNAMRNAGFAIAQTPAHMAQAVAQAMNIDAHAPATTA